MLDAGTDGLQQMAAILSGRTGIDALHVLSHGSAGTVNLGSLLLNHDNLSVHQSELQSIGQSLKSDADILLYGCDIGAGNGAHLLDDLALITGADLAASNNITGASTLGGDWVLEVHAGNIDTAPVVDAALSQLYSSVLAPFPGITFNTDANFVSYGGPQFIPPFATKLTKMAELGKFPTPQKCQIHVGSEDWQSNPEDVTRFGKLVGLKIDVVAGAGHMLPREYVGNILDKWCV